MEWIDLSQMAGLVNAVANPCGSIECGEFLDLLFNYQLLKKGSARWSVNRYDSEN